MSEDIREFHFFNKKSALSLITDMCFHFLLDFVPPIVVLSNLERCVDNSIIAFRALKKHAKYLTKKKKRKWRNARLNRHRFSNFLGLILILKKFNNIKINCRMPLKCLCVLTVNFRTMEKYFLVRYGPDLFICY